MAKCQFCLKNVTTGKKLQAEETDTADEAEDREKEDGGNKDNSGGRSGGDSLVEKWTPENSKKKKVSNGEMNREDLKMKKERQQMFANALTNMQNAQEIHLQSMQPAQKEPQDADSTFGNTVAAQMKLVILIFTAITIVLHLIPKLQFCLIFVKIPLKPQSSNLTWKSFHLVIKMQKATIYRNDV